MSNALSGLIGAFIGGAAAIVGAYRQARSAEHIQRVEAEQRANERRQQRDDDIRQERQLLARRYLSQLRDSVISLQRRVENWAWRGGEGVAEAVAPGYWRATSVYAFAQALGAERILMLDGVYVDLDALVGDAHLVPERAVEDAVSAILAPTVFYYDRVALAEAVLERGTDGFRLVTYSEFLARLKDPTWDLESLLQPVREALSRIEHADLKLLEERLEMLNDGIGRAIIDISRRR